MIWRINELIKNGQKPGVLCWLLITGSSLYATPELPLVSFNRQVLPILAEKCLKCHGQDAQQRKAKLRLDDLENSIKLGAVVPGEPDQSTLVERMETTDADELMPPPDEHKAMRPDEIALVRRWIAEGAEYEKHWSLIPPMAAEPAVVHDDKLHIQNPIDAFVLAHLEDEGLEPTPPASRELLLRRVTFDLTGLPPTLEELDAFLADESSEAFQNVVDELLKRTTYGEHMAVSWLDAARYADTFGRHEDADSFTWPWRDWVVRAFNQNLPYDQFVVWQTAGDMLPNPTQDMRLATTFNRLALQSNEAGSDDEEFRLEIVADRVKTNGLAFLGLSLECARCHDHKYDPISTKDYYSLSAFLNNIDEAGLYTVLTDGTPTPSMLFYNDEQQRQHIEMKLAITMKEREIAAALPQAHNRFSAWIQQHKLLPEPAKPLVHLDFETLNEARQFTNKANPLLPANLRLKSPLTMGGSGNSLLLKGDNGLTIPGVGDYTRTQPFSMAICVKLGDPQPRAVLMHHTRAGSDAGSRGYEVILEDNRPSFALCHFWPGNAIRVRTKDQLQIDTWTHIAVTYDGSSHAAGMKIYINGLEAETEVIRDHLYKDITYGVNRTKGGGPAADMLALADRYNDHALKNSNVDEFTFFDRDLSPVEVRLLSGSAHPIKPDDWFSWWQREVDEPSRRLRAELQKLRDQENAFSDSIPDIMIMKEQPQSRPTFVQVRGRSDTRGEQVQPDTPASVLPFPDNELPRSRLGYAMWLVDKRNPLTARVFVNRVWQMFFGRGLVVTSEDFGVQGQAPSHPELLDWLAVWFMDNGWNVKELCKLITTSATYQQSSLPADPAMYENDPDNTLLARGPSTRLTAEEIRDNALAVSGLLNDSTGGAPVFPYQSAGLWEDAGTQHTYTQSHGRDLHRRSLYTFWRRTAPPPSMSAFDAPTREVCKSRRERSGSASQALVIFNDPQFVEAARVLAEKLLHEFPTNQQAQVRKAFRLLTSRDATEWQTQSLLKLLQSQQAFFKDHLNDAEDLRRLNGETPPDTNLPADEAAALTVVTRGLLGFEQSIVKP